MHRKMRYAVSENGMTNDELRQCVKKSIALMDAKYAVQDERLREIVGDKETWHCVSCGKPIVAGEHYGHETDAVVMTSRAGYGSRYDMDLLVLVICDDCVEQKAKRAPFPWA